MTGEKKDRLNDDMQERGNEECAGDDELTQKGTPEEAGEHEGPKEREESLDEKLARENEELTNQMLYLRAELENFKKRTQKEKEQLVAYGNERLIRELIPVLDNLELGILHGKNDDEARQILSGVELTYNEFLNVLKKFGVEQLDAEDELFDPNVHEAVSSIPDPEKTPGTIYQVVRKGYTLKGRLLRPVQVVVVSEPDQGADDNEDAGGRTIN